MQDKQFDEIYLSLFEDEEKDCFLDTIFGSNSKMESEVFLEMITKEKNFFLQAHWLRQMVHKKALAD